MEQLSKISDILCRELLCGQKSSDTIKKATAFGFWSNICGSRFSKFSVPYDLKGKTLYVAVKSPQVMQELIFNKEKLLEKLDNYFSPLNLKVEEIRYNYKVWNKVNSDYTIKGDESLSYYSENELGDVPLNKAEQEDLKKVTNTILNLSFLDDKLKEKYAKNVVNSIKASKLRKN